MKAKTHNLNFLSGLFVILCMTINTATAEKLLTCSMAGDDLDNIKKIVKMYGMNTDGMLNNLTWEYDDAGTARFMTLGISGTSTLGGTDDSKYIAITVDYSRKHRNPLRSGSVDLIDTWTVYKPKTEDGQWKLQISVSSRNCNIKPKYYNIELSCNEVSPSALRPPLSEVPVLHPSDGNLVDFLKCDDEVGASEAPHTETKTQKQ